MMNVKGNRGILYIQAMGNMDLFYNKQKVYFNCRMTSRYMQLFLLLLFGGSPGKRGVKREVLLDTLYNNEEEDAGNALRINVSRLRRLLSEAGIPGEKFVTTEKEYYYLEIDCDLSSDVWEFEKVARSAVEETDEEIRIELLKKACQLYKGGFLAPLAGEEWVAVKEVYYQNLYFTCVREACRLLNSREGYEIVLDISRKAAELFPFEEWQLMEIDSLIHLDRYDDALRTYEDASGRNYEELGVSPSYDMLERFRTMSAHVKYSSKSLPEICHMMEEPNSRMGSYYSPYPSFVDCFRLFSRLSARNEWKGSLLMCTLENINGKQLQEPEKLQQAGEALMEALHGTLRKGDLYTRYSPGQFLVLLAGAGQKDCSVVTQRINRSFEKYNTLRVRVKYEISEVKGE